jgi:hypothetical protein
VPCPLACPHHRFSPTEHPITDSRSPPAQRRINTCPDPITKDTHNCAQNARSSVSMGRPTLRLRGLLCVAPTRCFAVIQWLPVAGQQLHQGAVQCLHIDIQRLNQHIGECGARGFHLDPPIRSRATARQRCPATARSAPSVRQKWGNDQFQLVSKCEAAMNEREVTQSMAIGWGRWQTRQTRPPTHRQGLGSTLAHPHTRHRIADIANRPNRPSEVFSVLRARQRHGSCNAPAEDQAQPLAKPPRQRAGHAPPPIGARSLPRSTHKAGK